MSSFKSAKAGILLALCMSVASLAPAAEKKTALVAVGTVIGAAEEAMAVMNHCSEIDPANKDVYDGLVLRLVTLYTPYYERADQILPAEGIKAGYPDGNKFRGAMLFNLRQLAQTEVKDLAATLTAAQDIASCQTQKNDFQQHKGLFAPPKTRFPAEVNMIDEWR